MTVRIIECEQGGEDWLLYRAGIATSSKFAVVLAKGKGKGEDSQGRAKYMRQLCAERITDRPATTYTNKHMERGRVMEAEARESYAFERDLVPELVGFMRRDDVRAGASPDSLIDTNGLCEIKTKIEDLQIEVLDRGEVPSCHIAQLQGQLWISLREWVDFVSYWPGLPLFVKRVYRDERYIAELAAAVREFNEELDALEERIRAM